MRREKFLTFFWSSGMSFLLAYGAVGALATGFGMAFSGWVPWILAMIAGICGICFVYVGGAPLALGALALGCGYAWRGGDLLSRTQILGERISRCFHSAYGWPLLPWADESKLGNLIDLPLLVLGGLIVLCVSWTVCRRRTVWWSAGLSALPVAICAVVTDTVPSSGMLAVYASGLLLLLITQGGRRKSPEEAGLLASWLAVPVVLFVGLMFYLAPRDTYQPLDKMTAEHVLDWWDTVRSADPRQELSDVFSGMTAGKSASTVKLDTLGERFESHNPVMTVTAPASGSLYLRGYAYDEYDGFSWRISEKEWVEPFTFRSTGEKLGTVQIETRRTQEVLYFPYVAGGMQQGTGLGGSWLNTENWKVYQFDQYRAAEAQNGTVEWENLQTVDRIQMEQYLRLPQETEQQAKQYLRNCLGVEPDGNSQYQIQQVAEKIRTHVAETWHYSLKAKKMPEAEMDFAMWFLTEGEQGYCVHYATAAAVLLRAVGIPARYVTGYLVDAQAGEAVEVTAKDAHAWVEYWNPDQGWLKLEATPGESSEIPEDTLPDPTHSEPEKTTAPEKPEPPEETVPLQTGALTGELPENPGKTQETGHQTELWKGIGLAVCVVLGLLIQWKLRIRCQKNRMVRGTTNEQAQYRWRLIQRKTRLLGVPISGEVNQLAERAMFSQHTLTAQEVAELDCWQREYERQLRKQSWLRRVISGLFFAAWG